MKQLFYIILTACITTSVTAQEFWVKPKKVADKWCLTEVSNGEIHFCESTVFMQNFNPVISLSNHKLDFALVKNNMLNVYTVYKTEENSLEQFIWGLSSGDQQNQVFTNYRHANLEAGKFMNFIDYAPGSFYLSNFVDQKLTESDAKLNLGGTAQRQDLPLKESSAEIAEMIVFDQPLSPIAKNMLETSLALKYSITLAPLTNYFLETNQIPLWDAQANDEFHHNIAGIAKNDNLLLYQKQSKSKVENGYLAIGHHVIAETNALNNSSFSANQSLLWGDNQQSISFLEGNEGMLFIQRNWKIENKAFVNEAFDVEMQCESISKQIPEGHSLWMKIQQNNEWKRYAADENKFNSVNFFDGSQTVSFLHAPETWADITIQQADCSNGKTAIVDVEIIGLSAPFSIRLINFETNEEIHFDNIQEQSKRIENLDAGKYSIRIFKDSKIAIEQQINITDSSIPEVQIARHFVFDSKENSTVDASYAIDGNWNYEWITPSNKIINGSIIDFNETGIYWLKIYGDACSSWTSIHVDIVVNNIRSVLLYPNPSPDGNFKIKLELENPYETEVLISNALGNPILRRSYKGAYIIEDSFRLFHNGIYFVTVKSASSINTKKLIVQYP